jgi:hypothetical protein
VTTPAPLPAELAGVCPLDHDPAPAHWDELADWGVTVVRQGFYWDWIQKEDGTFDFEWPDRYMAAAEARGIRVLVLLAYDSARIRVEGDPRPSVPPAALPEWLAYVRAVVTRYRDRAWGFEVWNEPNLDRFWQGPKADVVALARATVDLVHAEAPGVPVAVAGFSLVPVDWFAALDDEGVLAAADAVSFHPYWRDADGALTMLDAARAWLAARGLDKPLWLTEYGWPSGGRYPSAATLDEQAERLVRFLAGATTRGVRACWWYASRDGRDPDAVETPDDSEGFFGLAWPTAGPKPAGRAFRIMAGLLPHARPDPDRSATLAAATGVDALAFRRPAGPDFAVLTNRTMSARSLERPAGAVVAWPLEPPDPGAGPIPLAVGRSVVVLLPAAR